MEKPVMFISHITEEKDLAISLKELIEQSFLGMMDVFVSSDENSVSSGERWLDNITDALGKCSIELILCSPVSIKRPWINFEAGAGWIRKIPVIPLCHSGMEVNKLPIPLNLLQAVKITEIPSLKLIFPVLAKAVGSDTPNVDFTDFVQKAKEFEFNYTYWDVCKRELSKLKSISDTLYKAVKFGTLNIKTDVSQENFNRLQELQSCLLGKKGLFSIQKLDSASYSTDGISFTVIIHFSPELNKIANSPNIQI